MHDQLKKAALDAKARHHYENTLAPYKYIKFTQILLKKTYNKLW